jgi:hypothetical protein
LNTGPPNIGHSVALKARYQDGYTPRYYWTYCSGKLDLVLYRMKFVRLGKGSRRRRRSRTPGVAIISSLSSINSLSLSLNVKEVNPGLDPPHIHTLSILFRPALSAPRIHIALALVARHL